MGIGSMARKECAHRAAPAAHALTPSRLGAHAAIVAVVEAEPLPAILPGEAVHAVAPLVDALATVEAAMVLACHVSAAVPTPARLAEALAARRVARPVA